MTLRRYHSKEDMQKPDAAPRVKDFVHFEKIEAVRATASLPAAAGAARTHAPPDCALHPFACGSRA